MFKAVVPADTGDLTTGVRLVERVSFALCKLLLVLTILVGGDRARSESHRGRASCYCVEIKAFASFIPRS